MKRPSLWLAGVVLVVPVGLAGCGSATPQKVAHNATVPRQTLITGTWSAKAICPAVRAEINKQAPWAVQADNTNRACVIIGQVAAEQNVGTIVDLTGGRGQCPHHHFTGNAHEVQVSGLGSQACLFTYTRSGSQPVALAEWGIRFNAGHSIDINCSNQTNSNLAELMPECRMVLKAVLASLYRN